MGYYLVATSCNLEIMRRAETPDLEFIERVVGQSGELSECDMISNVFSDKNITVVCDAEGEMKGLKRTLMDPENFEFILGRVIIIGLDDNERLQLLTRHQVNTVFSEIVLHF